ncbi:MAG: hypothetical protein ACPG4Z_07560, partial [Chitinophagales bacterium]
MKIYKKLGSVFISLFIIHSALACGGGWWEAEYYNIYKQKQMLNENLYTGYNNHSADVAKNSVDDNIDEWYTFFEEQYTTSEIYDIIYNNISYTDYVSSKTTLENTLSNTSTSKRSSFVKYIMFAKNCEEISTANDSWSYYDEESNIDTLLLKKLTTICKANIKREKNEFIKERYHFQLVKIHYYGEMYEDAIAYYDDFFISKIEKSLINYWALDYKAGAEMQLGNTIQANYDFLQVFTNCPSRSHSSYHSMTFSNQEQFDQTIDFCENDETKAMFHFVRGINKNSVALEDIKSAQDYAPYDDAVKVLLSNEIVKIEHAYWNKHMDDDDEYDWHDHERIDIPNQQLMEYITDIRLFVENIINDEIEDDYWNITLAYLYSLEKNYQKSEEVLSKITASNDGYIKQTTAIQLLNHIHLHPVLTIEDENYLGKKWKEYNEGNAFLPWGDYGNINEYLEDYLHEYYEDKNEAMSMLFSGEDIGSIKWEDDGELLSPNSIKKLQESYLKLDKTELLQYGEQNFIRDTSDLEAELIELEATLYMRDPYSLEKAIVLFEKLSQTQQLEYNPFNMKVRDCIWGSWGDSDICGHKPTDYTKLTLAKKLLEMRIKAENEKSAMDYYLLGNAYYNMTYFGHEWEALSYYRSGSHITGFYDCTVALDLYENAIKLFTDEEMQAKSAFMAAKCEQNIYLTDVSFNEDIKYFSSWDYKTTEDALIAKNDYMSELGYRSYFKYLENDYSDTDFYDEIINECSF